MNEKIEIMIELQRYWDKKGAAEKEILRAKKSINQWKNEIIENKKEIESSKSNVKNTKLEISKSESELTDIDEKIKKTKEKRDLLKTERELEANSHELDKFTEECGTIEESLIELMDKLEKAEDEVVTNTSDESKLLLEVKKSMVIITEKISSYNEIVESNLGKFNKAISSLPDQLKQKFERLLSTKDGKAIGKIENEICKSCNFKVPSSLAAEASDDNKISTCSNCYRFIYS